MGEHTAQRVHHLAAGKPLGRDGLRLIQGGGHLVWSGGAQNRDQPSLQVIAIGRQRQLPLGRREQRALLDRPNRQTRACVGARSEADPERMHADRRTRLDVDPMARDPIEPEPRARPVDHVEATRTEPLGGTHQACRVHPSPLPHSVVRRHSTQLRKGAAAQ